MRGISVVIVGEVDHGKSSLIGRLLEETGAIPQSRIARVRDLCAAQGKQYEPAFLLDALEEEQRQGITIDVSHVHFATPLRSYHLIDTPGHREFLKNMVSGSSRADAAILLLDAHEGIREQTRRHCRLLSLLGIRELIVAINKLDLMAYAQDRFERLRDELTAHLGELGLTASEYIPLSAKDGENISRPPTRLPWYDGPTLVAALDALPEATEVEGPLRFAVQDVYKVGDRRIVAGRVEAGTLRAGDEITVWPQGTSARIATIEAWPTQPDHVGKGASVGFTLAEQAFIERGSIVTRAKDSVTLATTVEAAVFWMGRDALTSATPLRVKLLTQEVGARAVDADLAPYEAGAVTLQLSRPLVLDAFQDVPASGRFVLCEGAEVLGGGIVRSAQPLRHPLGWEFSGVSRERRTTRNGHRPAVIWLTGLSCSGKSTVARAIESELFARSMQVTVLDGDNLRHGLNSDLGFERADRRENARRVSAVAALFVEAGSIVITALISPFEADRELARSTITTADFLEVYLKCPIATCEDRDKKGLYRQAHAGLLPNFTGVSSPFEEPRSPDLVLNSSELSASECAERIIRVLETRGLFKG